MTRATLTSRASPETATRAVPLPVRRILCTSNRPSTIAFHACAVTGSPGTTFVFSKSSAMRVLLRRGCGRRPEDASAAKAENGIGARRRRDVALADDPAVVDVLDPNIDAGRAMPLERAAHELRHRLLAGLVEEREAAGQQDA